MKSKIMFFSAIAMTAMAATTSSVSFAERESGGRDSRLSMSYKAIFAALDTVRDLSAEIVSVRKIGKKHFVVEHLDARGFCVAQGYLLTSGTDAGGNIAYQAKSDNLRRMCITQPE